jgi:hypothetical protein
MVFVSNDRLHERCVPCFLTEHKAIVGSRELTVHQEFVCGRDLKVDLAKLDAHYSALPVAVREQGVMAFAQHPPTDSATARRGTSALRAPVKARRALARQAWAHALSFLALR